MEPIKFPSLLDVDAFNNIIMGMIRSVRKRYNIDLRLKLYVEPKYDGSNVRIWQGKAYTRGGFLITEEDVGTRYFALGLKKSMAPSEWRAIEELSRRYIVVIELGGWANSPAGYPKPWTEEWDYVVIAIIDPTKKRFLPSPEVRELALQHGLKVVDYRTYDAEYVVKNWKEILTTQYKDFEGFVAKLFLTEEEYRYVAHIKACRTLHEYRIVFGKYKHEYLEVKPDELPPSEILGAINKAHMEYGDIIIRNYERALEIVTTYVMREAIKHNKKAPDMNTITNYLKKYIVQHGGRLPWWKR